MPNHVTNGVSIKCDDANKLKELRNKLITKENGESVSKFDFNAVLPRPKELDITSGSETSFGMACYDQSHFDQYKQYQWFDKTYPNCKTPEDLLALAKQDSNKETALIEGKQALDNIKRYGYKDWYDWSIANWGTKWNAYDFSIVYEDDHELHVQFDTAWSAPTPIFNKLEDMGFDVSAVSINEDDGVEPDYYGNTDNFYVERRLEFYHV